MTIAHCGKGIQLEVNFVVSVIFIHILNLLKFPPVNIKKSMCVVFFLVCICSNIQEHINFYRSLI